MLLTPSGEGTPVPSILSYYLSVTYKRARRQRLWKVSLAVLGAATVADVQSSMGRRELNPLLNSSSGRFSMQGVAIKSAIVGGAIGIQYLLLRRNPTPAAYTAAAATNFAIAGVTGSIAARNHMVK